MGIRETLNEKKSLSVGIAVGICVLALIIIIWELHGSTPSAQSALAVGKAYYSDDDGKTFFVDTLDKIPPYADANGKTAVQAMVFRCGTSAPYVGYLQRFNDASRKLLEAGSTTRGRLGMSGGMEVKKPGAKTWVKMDPTNRAPYEAVTILTCPGGGSPQMVLPGTEENAK